MAHDRRASASGTGPGWVTGWGRAAWVTGWGRAAWVTGVGFRSLIMVSGPSGGLGGRAAGERAWPVERVAPAAGGVLDQNGAL